MQLDWQTAMQRAKAGGGGEPLPDGPYDVVVIEANPTTSSTNKPMIRVKYQVESGPHAGRKVFDQFVFSADNDNALSFFFQHMSMFGLDETFFAQNPSWEQLAQSLLNRRVGLDLGTRLWDGALRNEVKKYRMPGVGMPAGTMVPPAAPQMPMVPQPMVAQQPLPPYQPPAPVAPVGMPQDGQQQFPAPQMPPQAPPMPQAPVPPAAPPAPPQMPQPAVAQPQVPPVPQAPQFPAPQPAPAPAQPQYEVPQVAQMPAAPQMPQVPPAPQFPQTTEEPV